MSLRPIAPDYVPLNNRLNESVQRNLNAAPGRLAEEVAKGVALNNSLANARAVEGLNRLNAGLKKAPLKLNINRSVHQNMNVKKTPLKLHINRSVHQNTLPQGNSPWNKLGRNLEQREFQRQRQLNRKENENMSNKLFSNLSAVHRNSPKVLMSKWNGSKNRRNRKTRRNRRSRKTRRAN